MAQAISEDALISLLEAATALEMPEEALASLTGPGPFCANAGGLTMRKAFGASLAEMLPFEPAAAVAIALEAARGAEIGGGRSLMLMWPSPKAIIPCWITAADRRPPVPVHIVPVDEMMGLLALHLTAGRQGAVRPN